LCDKKEQGNSIIVAKALVYTMNTNGLIPLVIAVFAKMVSPMVQPSIITMIMNGTTSDILVLPSIEFSSCVIT